MMLNIDWNRGKNGVVGEILTRTGTCRLELDVTLSVLSLSFHILWILDFALLKSLLCSSVWGCGGVTCGTVVSID